MQRVLELLQSSFGFDPTVLGTRSVWHAVERRMQDQGYVDHDAYFAKLSSDSDEAQALVNLITVPETWFLRDEKPFAYLTEWAIRIVSEQPQSRPLMILSAPCSSGEEAYSIAIALFETGRTDLLFQIDAFDVNSNSIAKAKAGVYRASALRAVPERLIERYFEEQNGNFLIRDWLRERVTFFQRNIMDFVANSEGRTYDVIFCRNLLIYFTEEKQKELLTALSHLLVGDGCLILGHAEINQFVLERFVLAGPPGAFVVKKRGTQKIPNSHAGKVTKSGAVRGRTPSRAEYSGREDAGNAAAAPADVAEIEELANTGQIAEAVQRCDVLLEAEAAEASVLFVCGLVYEANGERDRATTLFERVIVANPSHYQAHVHLAASMEAAGDAERAAELREKAKLLAGRRR